MTTRIRIIVRNDRSRALALAIEPWAREISIAENGSAEVVADGVDLAEPLHICITDDCVAMDAGLDVKVAYAGKEFEFKNE